MMMQKYHFRYGLSWAVISVVSIVCVCVVFLFVRWFIMERVLSGKTPSLMIGGTTYAIELASTDIERTRGLSHRDGLCSVCGMLFIFDAPDFQSFWMMDMRFPLDIIWISERHVVHIEHRIQADDKRILRPDVKADMVLELNAGAADNLAIGESVVFLR
jgi:uncharacterized membrane protein (UPF0127 family)